METSTTIEPIVANTEGTKKVTQKPAKSAPVWKVKSAKKKQPVPLEQVSVPRKTQAVNKKVSTLIELAGRGKGKETESSDLRRTPIEDEQVSAPIPDSVIEGQIALIEENVAKACDLFYSVARSDEETEEFNQALSTEQSLVSALRQTIVQPSAPPRLSRTERRKQAKRKEQDSSVSGTSSVPASTQNKKEPAKPAKQLKNQQSKKAVAAPGDASIDGTKKRTGEAAPVAQTKDNRIKTPKALQIAISKLAEAEDREEKLAAVLKNTVALDPIVVQCILMVEHNKLPITVISAGQENTAKSLGFKTRMKRNSDTSTHGLAQLCRKIAQHSLMILLAGDIRAGTCSRVVDMYGSERLAKIFRRSCIPRNPVVQLVVERPRLTGKDFVSNPEPTYPVEFAPNDVLVYTDVYIKPEQVLSEMKIAGSSRAYFLCIDHDDRFEAGTMFWNEACWYQASGKIVHFSGESETPWCPTEFISEWFTDSHYSDGFGSTLVWDAHRRFGNYTLFKVAYTKEEIPLLSPPIERPRPVGVLIERKTMPDPRRWWQKMTQFLEEDPFNRELLVFVPAYEKLTTAMANKTRQGYQFSSLTSDVSMIMAKKEFEPFWRIYPDKQRVASDTVHYLMWSGLNRDVDNHTAALRAFGSTAAFFKQIRSAPKQLAPGSGPEWPRWMKIVAVVAGLLVTFFLKRYVPSENARATSLDAVQRFGEAISRSIIKYSHEFISTPYLAIKSLVPAPPSEGTPALTPFLQETIQKIKGNILSFLGPLGLALAQAFLLKDLQWGCVGALLSFLPITVGDAVKTFAMNAFFFLDREKSHNVLAVTSRAVTPLELESGIRIAIAAPIVEEAIKCVVGPLVFGTFEAVVHTIDSVVAVRHALPPEHQPMIPGIAISMFLSKVVAQVPTHESFVGPTYFKSVVRHILWNASTLAWNPQQRVTLGLIQAAASLYDSGNTSSILLNSSLMIAGLTGNLLMTGQTAMGCIFGDSYSLGIKIEEDSEIPEIVELTPGARLPANRTYAGYEEYAKAFDIPLDLYDGREETVFVHELLTTTAQFTRPAGIYHMIKAIQTRNRVIVPMTETCEGAIPCKMHDDVNKTGCPMGREWSKLQRHFLNFLGNRRTLQLGKRRMKRKDWAKKFNGAAKTQRAMKAISDREEGHLQCSSDIFFKGDEVLYPRPDGFKGRTIKAIHPSIQADLAPQIARAMKHLKSVFNEDEVHHISGWEFTFTIGSGKTARELDVWRAKALDFVSGRDQRIAAIFAGDDLYFLASVGGIVYAVESDMGKFDRTQGAHALTFEFAVLERLEVLRVSLRRLAEAMSGTSTYEEKSLGIRWKIEMSLQRATGAPDTTIGNSITNMGSLFYYIKTAKSDTDFSDLGPKLLKLGFVANAIVRPLGHQATFLKGWWLPGMDDDAYWLPLPSQVVKLGKILTDPFHIFKGVPEHAAWSMAAIGIAKGVGFIPPEYPILGPFIHKLLGLENSLKLSEKESLLLLREQEHKVTREGPCTLDRQAVLEEFGMRYGLTTEEIEEAEELIVRTPFPARLHHRVFLVLAEVDYA